MRSFPPLPYAAPGVPRPAAPPASPPIQRAPRFRAWHALLALYLLAPLTGEMLSGSTPPLQFINPFSLLVEAGLYGTGAVLVRELARRRGGGWTRILLLGLAYGILEEGLVVTSWFNPYWPDIVSLGDYGRIFGANWVWALGLTLYHAVVSIAVPIILVEALFPRAAARAWLGRKGLVAFVVLMAVVSVVELLLFGFVGAAQQSKGAYTHPPTTYLVALALFVGFIWLGLRRRRGGSIAAPAPPAVGTPAPGAYPVSAPMPPGSPPVVPSAPTRRPRRPPRLWTLRALAVSTTITFFFLLWVGPKLLSVAAVQIALLLGLATLAGWRLRRWAARPGWGARQRLALAAGVVFFFVLFAPLVEFAVRPSSKNFTGMTVAAVGWLALIIALSWRARGAERRAGAG